MIRTGAVTSDTYNMDANDVVEALVDSCVVVVFLAALGGGLCS